MKKRILAILLCAVMLVSVLASCADKKKAQGNDPSQSTTSDKKGEYAYIDEYVRTLASDKSFGGNTFTVIGKHKDHCDKEEVIGNLENDALYNRMREIEEIFGVTFEYTPCDGENHSGSPSLEVLEKVETDVMSDFGSYDLIHSNIMVGGKEMLASNLIQPVESFGSFDFSQPWWINDIESQFGIGGHLYYLTGKMVTGHYSDPSCVLFNKKIAENYNIPDLYEIVSSGQWTFDKMIEVSQVIPSNSDTYRIMMGSYEDGLGLYFSAGFSLSEVDEEGCIFLPTSLTNEKVDFIDKVAAAIGDDGAYYIDQRNSVPGNEVKFEEDAALFTTDCMGAVSFLREEDIEFGVLPMPKRDVTQKDYISYSQAMQVCGYTISRVAKDPECSATIAEAMAALSEKWLEPAYYDKALKGRGTYDNESRDMLDLIYRTKKVDYAATYQWGDIWKIVDDAITGMSDSYVSDYSSASRFAAKKIKSLYTSIEKNDK